MPDNFYDATDTAHYIEMSNDITIPAGVGTDTFGVYMVSARVCAYPKDSYVKNSVVVRIQIDTDTATFWGDNWQADITWSGYGGEAIRPFEDTGEDPYAHALGNRGFTRIGFRAMPGGSGITGKIRIWVHGPCTNLDSLWVDCVRIEPCNYFGIASPYNGALADIGDDSLYLIPPANQTITSTTGISDGANHLTILNGTISMAKRSPWPFGMNAIHTSGLPGQDIDNTTMIGVTLKTFGEVTAPYYQPQADYDTIMFCKILDSATGIWQRDDNLRAVQVGYESGNNYFGHNYLTTLRHCGVGIGFQDSNATMNNTLEHNFIEINSKHMNGVGATCHGVIRGNRIITYSDASDNYWGGGNCITSSGPHEEVYDNVCLGEAGWCYEARRMPVYGIQIEGLITRTIKIDNNILDVLQHRDEFTTTYTSGIQMTTCGGDNYIHNNWIRATDTTSSSVASGNHGRAIQWIYDEGASGEDLRGNHFYQNHLEGSGSCVNIKFPALWSNGGFSLSQDTLVKPATTTNGFTTFGIVYNDSTTDTNCIFLGGAANDDYVIYGDGNKTTWWTTYVSTGDDGTSVWAVDSLGRTVDSGLTSGGGRALMLRELVVDFDTDLDTTFNTHIVFADNGYARDSLLSFAAEQWDTVTFSLASGTVRKVRVRR